MHIRLEPGHDLETAVKNAPDGAVIELDAGDYRLERGLYVHRSLTLKGAGADATRLVCTGEAYVLCYRGRGSFAASGIGFVHEGEAWGDGLVVEGGTARLEGCAFTGAVHRAEDQRGGDGLVLGDATGGTVRDCESYGNQANGIRLWGQSAPVLDGNRAFDNGWNGIVYFGATGGTARDNRCERNGCNGIGVNGAAQVVVEGNSLIANAWNGLCFVDDTGGTVRSNHCERNEGSDIYVAGPVRLRLEDNTAVVEVFPPEHDEDGHPRHEPESPFDLLGGAALELRLGTDLTALVDPAAGGLLMERLGALRRALTEEMGLVMPGVHVDDDPTLPVNGYMVRIRQAKVAEGELFLDHRLALGATPGELSGIPATEPGTGAPALWLTDDQIELAHQLGHATLDAADVLLAHMAEALRAHGHALLSRDALAVLLDRLHDRAPTVIDELKGGKLPLGVVQAVLQNLLRERVSIRDLPYILERLVDLAGDAATPFTLTERLRARLSHALGSSLADENGVLTVWRLAPALERRLVRAIAPDAAQPRLVLSAALQERLIARLVMADVQARACGAPLGDHAARTAGQSPVLVVGSALRPHLPPLLARALPQLRVLSPEEIHPSLRQLELGRLALEPHPLGERLRAWVAALRRPKDAGLSVRWVR